MKKQLLSPALGLLLLWGCSDSSNLARPVPTSSLTVVPSAAPEGLPGEMRSLHLRVTLTEPNREPVTVRYRTEPITATAEVDYLSSNGEIEIPAGAVEGRITLELIGDATEEPGETIAVHITTSDNAVPTETTVTATIANDDTPCDSLFSSTPNRWLVNGGDPLNFAHRGGKTTFPENTLYAYSEAAIAGVDVLEMDVFQTKDNHLVILHDQAGVGRTTDGEGMIVDMTLQEVKALDAAYWFVPGEGTQRGRPEEEYVYRGVATGDKPPPPGYSPSDFRIPTLEEALQRFPQELINVELKEDDGIGNYEEQMRNLLVNYGRLDDLIVATFDDAVSATFREVAPCLPISLPLGEGLTAFAIFLTTGTFPEMPQYIAAQIPPDTSQIGDQIPGDDPIPLVTPELVEAAHAVNVPIQVWTINACEDMLRMMELGVDGIMTDVPFLLEELLSTPAADRSCD